MWLQNRPDVRSPVTDGELGAWIPGIEWIICVAVTGDLQGPACETALVQVTVDNHPPEINIVFLMTPKEVPKSTGDIILQAR